MHDANRLHGILRDHVRSGLLRGPIVTPCTFLSMLFNCQHHCCDHSCARGGRGTGGWFSGGRVLSPVCAGSPAPPPGSAGSAASPPSRPAPPAGPRCSASPRSGAHPAAAGGGVTKKCLVSFLSPPLHSDPWSSHHGVPPTFFWYHSSACSLLALTMPSYWERNSPMMDPSSGLLTPESTSTFTSSRAMRDFICSIS